MSTLDRSPEVAPRPGPPPKGAVYAELHMQRVLDGELLDRAVRVVHPDSVRAEYAAALLEAGTLVRFDPHYFDGNSRRVRPPGVSPGGVT